MTSPATPEIVSDSGKASHVQLSPTSENAQEYRDKAEYLTEKGKERALRALADRLKEGGHYDSGIPRKRIPYRLSEGDFPDFDDLRAVGKQADHRNGEGYKADDAEQHEHRRYKEGQIHRLTAALCPSPFAKLKLRTGTMHV